MMIRRLATVVAVLALTVGIVGCETAPSQSGSNEPAGKTSYVTRVIDGKMWVFVDGSEELKTVDGGGELAKHVTRIANVGGKVQTIKAPDAETLNGYLASNSAAKTSHSEATQPVSTTVDDNLAIASKVAAEAQAGIVASNAGTHSNTKPDAPKVVAPTPVPTPTTAKAVAPTAIRNGFVIFDAEDATWVFATNSKELAAFKAGEELAKHSTKLKATPGGIVKVKAPDQETIDAFMATKAGFVTRVIDGYLWVFYEGSAEHKAVDGGTELAKHVTKLTNVGGKVRTIKAPAVEVLEAYNAATPGIAARIVDGYLWVFAPKSETLALVDSGSEPAKHVTKLISVNGRVRTVRAGEMDVINAYHAAKPGFETLFIDGYTWVFKQGSPELSTVLNGGELAKHVTKMSPSQGTVRTYKAPDADTLAAYMGG